MVPGSPCSTVPETPPSPAAAPASPSPPRNSWLAAQGRLPLAFMGLALAWLVAATALLAVRSELPGMVHLAPPVVALAHAWLLGFFVTVACGAVYQLVPVALGTTLWNENIGWIHFGLHAVAVPGMVYAFWHWELRLLGVFGGALALGIVLFALNTWLTVKSSVRRDVTAWAIVLATGWLLATVLVGLALVANRLSAFIPLDPVSLLRAHAHLGLVGFFVTLLQGVGFQLVPMFTLGEVRHWGLAKAGLWCSQLGLAALLPGLVWQLGLLAFGGALAIAVGLVFSGIGLKNTLATRKKRRLDPGLVAFLYGGAGLCAAAVVGTALLLPGVASGGAAGGSNAMAYAMSYALLGILGGLLPCVAGMMCKVVPFLTWMRAYGPRVGRGPTPPAHSLTHPQIERWALALQPLSVIPLLVGVWASSGPWLRLGTWTLAAGVALFVIDMLGVLKHLWYPATAASSSSREPTLNPQKKS